MSLESELRLIARGATYDHCETIMKTIRLLGEQDDLLQRVLFCFDDHPDDNVPTVATEIKNHLEKNNA